MRSFYESSPADDEIQDFGRRAWELVSLLNPRQAYALSLLHIHGLTLREAAVVLEVSPERVRQIEREALRKLRRKDLVGALGDPPFQRRGIARHPGFAWESEL